jgi:hypothetical protein
MAAAFAITFGLLCLLIAYIGRQTVVGFWGMLVLCLLLSPFVMSLILLVASQRRMT